ncbi:Lon-like protease with PDZ [Furfurilactobacillus rossiae]|uniref:SepM family pheromone-processing serine protease n=1 Tax=Furfurilactobacillus rossiae TaxID=231049 RepID=UPI0015BA8392|nr:SepM family pheromone-processing serine protease [Furfurilactobacillus rossiae]MCF6165449.1 PDZ domain-containing protein [Furfurilactobacillus rossiae]QLE64261.1 Lon-like protease with PDZ [Furfurilactobacillus rossiae]
MKKRRWGWWLGGAIVIVGLLVMRFLPLNQYIETPGTADNLRDFVTMPTRPDKRKGDFMITSVYQQQATPISWLWAHVDPHATIYNEQEVTGGENQSTYNKVQGFYMQSAINQAIATAYKAADEQYTRQYLGIYVLDVLKTSHFYHKIQVGDTVTKIDGVHYDSSVGYQKALAKRKLSDKVAITYTHNGKERTTKAGLIRLPDGRSGIGITLTDDVKVSTKIPVEVNAGQIGGPSGGLMFSLQIYQQLTNQNLRHGQKIAGTGTINADGSVGEIGGIDKKVVAAHKAGAKIFFAPYLKPSKEVLKYEEGHKTNYQWAKETAKKYAPGMKVVPVSSFDQAVKYLQTHK